MGMVFRTHLHIQPTVKSCFSPARETKLKSTWRVFGCAPMCEGFAHGDTKRCQLRLFRADANSSPDNFSNLKTINDMWTGGGPMTASYISPLLYLCSAFERSLMDCQRKRGLVVPRKCSKPNPSENLNVSRPRRRKSKKRRLGEKRRIQLLP